jgi:hypothetical protein
MTTTTSVPTPQPIDHGTGRARPVEPPFVPYVTAWSAERADSPDLVVLPGSGGIAHRDETPSDRDERGVLLARSREARGRGRALFGVVHAARQRHAMRVLLCQVCGNPADTNDDGTLWLLQDHRADWPNWPDGMACTEPPVCADCVVPSTRSCPALRRSHVLVRVRSAPVVGVHGTLWTRSPVGVLTTSASVIVTFDDPRVHRVLASHLVRELRQAVLVG